MSQYNLHTWYTQTCARIPKTSTQQDIRHLLMHSLKITSTQLYLAISNLQQIIITNTQKLHLDHCVSLLLQGMPLSKIIHSQIFYGREFYVNKYVLCPRSETEHIIDHTIKHINHLNKSEIKILDLGTGSGCIPITIAKELQDRQICIHAIDTSMQALQVAKHNAKMHHCSIELYKSDWFNNVKETNFDIIISNPPYIDSKDYIHKSAKFDPNLALFASKKGFECYQIIMSQAVNFLTDQGIIILEMPGKFQSRLSKYSAQFDIKYHDTYSNIKIVTCVKKN